MNLELDPEEERALAAELRRVIADDRYPLSRRIRTLRGILDKLAPPKVREPLPPPKVYAPPRAEFEPAPRPAVKFATAALAEKRAKIYLAIAIGALLVAYVIVLAVVTHD